MEDETLVKITEEIEHFRTRIRENTPLGDALVILSDNGRIYCTLQSKNEMIALQLIMETFFDVIDRGGLREVFERERAKHYDA